jgi:uncharacterized protein YoxC
MVLEVAAVIAVVIFAVLAAATIQTQLKLQRTLAEAQRVLGTVQQEIPVLAVNLNAMACAVTALSIEARRGVDQASGFLGAVEEAGEGLKQMQRLVYGKGDAWYMQARGVWAGVRAASLVLLGAVSLTKGRHSNGQ